MYKFLIILVLGSLCSCKQDSEPIDRRLILPRDSGVHETDSVIMDSVTGTCFSRILGPNGVGMTYTYTIPKTYMEKELYVIFKGLARSNYAISKGVLVFTAFDEGWQQLCWWAIPIRSHLKYQSQWNPFIDSMHIPALIEKRKYTYIKACPFIGESTGEKLDIDSFEVSVKKRGEY